MPTPLKRIPFETGRDSMHTKIVQAVRDRKRFSEQQMKTKRKYFDKLENAFLAAGMPETELDARLRQQRDNNGKPNYTTIQIPYTYAETMTMYTYFASVMLSRSPVFQYNGRGGEDQVNKMAVEALMSYQTRVGRNLVPLFVWLQDATKYGIGCLGTYWCTDYYYYTDYVERPVILGPLQVPGAGKREEVEMRLLKYLGNRFFNVRPQNMLPDPRVPLLHIDKGEFFGRKLQLSWNELVRGEREGRYMNVRAVKERGHVKAVTSHINEDVSEHLQSVADAADALLTPQLTKIGMVDAVEMKIELIPDEWGLGKSKYPRKWVFTVVADEIVIEAREQGAYHDTFGYFIMEPEADGHSLLSRSPSEVIQPLEDVLTWLFNSHMYNVRRALVDQFIVNPAMVEMDDLEDPLPGGYIRLKPAAYDKLPKDVVHQLQVHDITQQHLASIGPVVEIIQRIDGVNDSILGMMQQGGRKTATEVRSGTSFGVSRLKTKSEFMAAQGLEPLAQVALQLTQQYYDQEMEFRVVGDLLQQGRSVVNVTPDTIAGAYDYVPIDGSAPVDRFALASLWRQILVDAARVPQLQNTLDFAQVFSHAAKLAGATEVDQFRIQVVPDGQFAAGVQAGNVVPIGGSPANGPGQSVGAEGRLPNPSQTAGLGPVG